MDILWDLWQINKKQIMEDTYVNNPHIRHRAIGWTGWTDLMEYKRDKVVFFFVFLKVPITGSLLQSGLRISNPKWPCAEAMVTWGPLQEDGHLRPLLLPHIMHIYAPPLSPATKTNSESFFTETTYRLNLMNILPQTATSPEPAGTWNVAPHLSHSHISRLLLKGCSICN